MTPIFWDGDPYVLVDGEYVEAHHGSRVEVEPER